MGSTWPCLRSGKLQPFVTQKCFCSQTRDKAFATVLFGVTERILSNTDGNLIVIYDDLEALEEDDMDPFCLSAALNAICEEAASEFINFLNASLENHKYGDKEIRIMNPRSSYVFSNCQDEDYHQRAELLVDSDHVADAEEVTKDDESVVSQPENP